jgi:putative hydrolase of the HAD superfamily
MAPTIIFDLDGVLLYLDWDIVCAPLARLSDRTYDEVMKEVQNGPIVDSSMLGRLTPREFHRAICDEIHVAIDFDPFIDIWNSILSIDDDMADFVEKLATTHTLVIASNTDAIHFAYSLERYPAFKAFGRHFLSCEMGLLKPGPAYFHHVLYELWASSANCVFIDDRPDNVRAARNLGIKGLVFESIAKLKSDLSQIL